MTPLPMTVISGYLGAGKTTLINRMLADPQGLRLTVMVNDFGAINIDHTLISARTDGVIALTNGCVCCTMGADLFLAVADALDRRPRTDHLIVEASGIADPKAIANIALAEPDLRYAGIVTLVDALNILPLLEDALIAPQVHQQIAVADLVLQTKRDSRDPDIDRAFAHHGLPMPQHLPGAAIGALMLDTAPPDEPPTHVPHPAYTRWHHRGTQVLDHDRLVAGLQHRPDGLFRLKGIVLTTKGTFEIHAVGRHSEIKEAMQSPQTVVVGLGLQASLELAEVDAWWKSLTQAAIGTF